jgi:hypothetical protein
VEDFNLGQVLPFTQPGPGPNVGFFRRSVAEPDDLDLDATALVGTEFDAGQPRVQEGRRGLDGVDAHRQIDAPVAHDRDPEINRHYTGRGDLLAQSGGNLGAIAPYATALSSSANPPEKAVGRSMPGTSWLTLSRELGNRRNDGPPRSFALGARMIAVVLQGAWHRVHSMDGVMVMIAALLPGGDNIDLDVDGPRTVERGLA